MAASLLSLWPQTGHQGDTTQGEHQTVLLSLPTEGPIKATCWPLPYLEIGFDSVSLSSVEGAHISPSAPWPWVHLSKP